MKKQKMVAVKAKQKTTLKVHTIIGIFFLFAGAVLTFAFAASMTESMQLTRPSQVKKVKTITLNVCDHNNDGIRSLADVSILASCPNFDADGNGIHSLNDVTLYAANNQFDTWCNASFVCEPQVVAGLNVCDHNNDGVRGLADVSMLAGCPNFDVNADGIHSLNDVTLYAASSQSDTWCNANFVCEPQVVAGLNVCDHNNDGIRNVADVSLLAGCPNFDVNADGIHSLNDVTLYAASSQSDTWCNANFVCDSNIR